MDILTVIPKDINNIIPLIFEYKKEIKTIHLIYDTSVCEFEKAMDLKNGLINLNNKYSLNWEIKFYPIDEDKKENIEKTVSFNFDYLFIAENTDVSLSILLGNLTLDKNGIIYSYDKGENTYNIISKNTFKNQKIKHNLKLEDYLTMLNYKIKSKTTLNDIKQRRKLVLKAIKSSNPYDSVTKDVLTQLGVFKNGKLIKSSFGGIFEEYIFWQLVKFDFDEIWMNVEVISEKIDKEEIINEIDILGIKENTIYTFEVKKGILVPFKNKEGIKITPKRQAGNIVYKLDSIMSIFGRYTKGMIINLNRFPKQSFSKNLTKRAEENNILIYEFQNFDFNQLKQKLLKQNIFERVFLLGGRDLEMQAIKEILISFEIKFYDKNLSWEDAKLSVYKEFFNKTEHFYAIELIPDTILPKHFTLIDHHNQNRYSLSSLEQIAKILNYKLSRKQKLIALNDRDYIFGMKKFGANINEIENIRKKDRFYQGVTEDEEIEALNNIKNAKKIGDLLVIKTKNRRFSPIADKIFPKEAIIYNEDEINYYGKRVNLLVKHFQNLINEKTAYFGKGFFGITKNPNFYKDKILEILQKN